MIQKIAQCLAACTLALLLFGGVPLFVAWIEGMNW